MTTITDEFMQAVLAQVQPYCVVILKAGPHKQTPAADHIIWEHGRRNFALRADGKLPIVCPATDDSDWAGIAIFDASVEEVDRIMADDPGVASGVFTYELHPVHGFPGSALP